MCARRHCSFVEVEDFLSRLFDPRKEVRRVAIDIANASALSV
jgi:hypothetical protein